MYFIVQNVQGCGLPRNHKKKIFFFQITLSLQLVDVPVQKLSGGTIRWHNTVIANIDWFVKRLSTRKSCRFYMLLYGC